MTNGLVQHVTVEESTSIQWVNQYKTAPKQETCNLRQEAHQQRRGLTSLEYQFGESSQPMKNTIGISLPYDAPSFPQNPEKHRETFTFLVYLLKNPIVRVATYHPLQNSLTFP